MLSVFTFVYNSDAAMMMVAQCSCNHSQLNIRSVPNIQSSPVDLTQWKDLRRMSWIQRLRLIPHQSARVFGVSLFVLGAIYAENESMKTRLPWPTKIMTQECALVDNIRSAHTGIPPVCYYSCLFKLDNKTLYCQENKNLWWPHIMNMINHI